MIQISYKLFQRREEEETSQLIFGAIITLMPKNLTKILFYFICFIIYFIFQKKKNNTVISYTHPYKKTSTNTSRSNPDICKRYDILTKSDLFMVAKFVQHLKTNECNSLY